LERCPAVNPGWDARPRCDHPWEERAAGESIRPSRTCVCGSCYESPRRSTAGEPCSAVATRSGPSFGFPDVWREVMPLHQTSVSSLRFDEYTNANNRLTGIAEYR